MPGAVPVEPDGRAAAPRGARHRADLGLPALLHARHARHLPCLAPAAVLLADHEPPSVGDIVRILTVIPVVPAGRAVARRGTGHGQDLGVAARVQGPQAGHLDRAPPAALLLDLYEPLDPVVPV